MILLNHPILLVEDHQNLGKTFLQLFQALPVHLTLAPNASHAMECLNQEKFDLMILDLQDPEFYKFSTLFQADHTPSCSEVIDLSDRKQKADLPKILRCLNLTYLPKPFDPDRLLMVVSKIFELQSS